MTDDHAEEAADDRDESDAERQDRKYDDLLQELRVIQTSAQLTAGFLLTLPFQQRFSDLSTGQERFYLVLVVLAALVTAVVLSPVAIHRQLSGLRVKRRLVEAAHTLVEVALGLLALLATGIVVFVFDVVTDLTAAVTVGAALLVVLCMLMVVLPRMLVARGRPTEASRRESQATR
jgi:SNF family Na+-dependent transporter